MERTWSTETDQNGLDKSLSPDNTPLCAHVAFTSSQRHLQPMNVTRRLLKLCPGLIARCGQLLHGPLQEAGRS